MDMKPWMVMSLSLACVLCEACGEEKAGAGKAVWDGYRGDGWFADRGPRVAANRYLLELGKIDFSRRVIRTFKMSGLPETRFTVGFVLRALPPLEPVGKEQKDYNRAEVRILLLGKGGKKLLDQKARFSEWTWSGSIGGTSRYVYLRGDPGRPGPSQFAPKQDEEYFLTVEIEPLSDPGKVVEATLELQGGGRKVE